MDRRAVAAQERLAHAVEIDDHRHDLVAVARALRDRFADELVGERGRKLVGGDDSLRLDRGAEQTGDCCYENARHGSSWGCGARTIRQGRRHR